MACHSRAMQGEIIPSAILLNIVLRRILFYFCFSNAVWASASGGFRIVFDTLVLHYFAEPDIPLFAHFEAGLSIHPSIHLFKIRQQGP